MERSPQSKEDHPLFSEDTIFQLAHPDEDRFEMVEEVDQLAPLLLSILTAKGEKYLHDCQIDAVDVLDYRSISDDDLLGGKVPTGEDWFFAASATVEGKEQYYEGETVAGLCATIEEAVAEGDVSPETQVSVVAMRVEHVATLNTENLLDNVLDSL